MKTFDVKIKKPVDEVIERITEHIQKLEKLRDQEGDEDKKFLLGTLRNIFQYTLVSLALFQNEEFQDSSGIFCQMESGNNIEIPVDGEFIGKAIKRLLLLDIWGQFEFYFFKKVPNSDRMPTKRMIDSYFNPKKTPHFINFFREMRNSIHENAVYSKIKPNMRCSIDGVEYPLEKGKEVIISYKFLVDITSKFIRLV